MTIIIPTHQFQQKLSLSVPAPSPPEPYAKNTPIVAMWGLGEDSFNGIQKLIHQLIAEGYPLHLLTILVSMTGLEWSYGAGYLNELHFLPILAQHKIRLIQIIKAGPRVHDRYTILSDSRSPRKLWLYGKATPPLSPISEGIPYDIEGLRSPQHPLWNPDAVWDLAYRPENFGPPDPYLHLDNEAGTLTGQQIFLSERSHRHHVCRLPGYDPTVPYQFAEEDSNPDPYRLEPTLGIGDYYLSQGTLPQFRSNRRDCSVKFKQGIGDQAVESLADTWSLGENLLSNGVIPQFADNGRICSDRFKQEGSQQLIHDQFGEHSLGQDLLANGVVPQVAAGAGRGKCSNKSKQVPCNLLVEDAAIAPTPATVWRMVDGVRLEFDANDPTAPVPLPPFVTVCIFFNSDPQEQKRRVRGEFAVQQQRSNRKQPVKPVVYRLMRYPLQERGIGRKQLEFENQLQCGEPHNRSACSCCCFANICGADDEVLSKHQRMPVESGLACLIEYVARCLNSRQTTFPKGRGLLEMVQTDGNWEALMNFQERLAALPWAIYRVQRITGGTPWRNTRILATGDRPTLEAQFQSICQQHNAYPACDLIDHMERGWIEFETWQTTKIDPKTGKPVEVTHTLQDCIVLCPAIPVEKSRKGWAKAWATAHTVQLSLFNTLVYASNASPQKASRQRTPSDRAALLTAAALLKVQLPAKPAQVQKAYHQAAKHCHPDGATPNPERFRAVHEAYQLLMASKQRRKRSPQVLNSASNGG